MADLQPISRAFPNGGLQLKQDPALLDESHYSELTNVVSVQEGNITVRAGSQKITRADEWQQDFDEAPVIHSISALHVGDLGEEILYVGEDVNIWSRINGGDWNEIATGVAPSDAYARQRFSAISYSAGSSGLPYQYFACPSAMLKDSGINPATASPGLQKWGILPPVQPVQAALGAYTLLPPDMDVVYNLAVGSDISRLPYMSVAEASGTVPGNITITPSTMSGINVGMLLQIVTPAIGGVPAYTQYAPVLSSDSTTFSVYLEDIPNVGALIQAAEDLDTDTGSSDFVTLATMDIALDASFDGIPSTGYSTDDLVHISVYASDPAQYTDIRFRVLVNNSNSDYYEKSILPTAIQPQVTGTQTSTQNLSNIGATIPQSALNDTPYISQEITQAKAQALAAVSAEAADSGNAVWTEISIPKSQFLAVGNAGNPVYSWKNVTGFQVVYKTVAVPTGSPEFGISSIYIAGGAGPSAVTTSSDFPLQPYSYIFTFRNPITGAEGNPCALMIPTAAVSPQRQGVDLTLYGTDDPQITGENSISVYRAGGSFSDSYYRFVGYAANPGAGETVIFSDQQSDQSIDINNLVDFDNDTPVTSALPTPVVMTSSTVAVANTLAVLNVIVTSGSLASLTVGTPLTVGINTLTQETSILAAVDAVGGTVTLFLQYDHSDAATNPITIQADAIANQPVTLSLEAFDSVFLAGDPNNPHVLYQSKTGRPEAFPIINLTTNVANAINVGTPSNYIVNMTEFSGGVLCMNLNNLYYVAVASGQMEAPIATPAQRGLLATKAWCMADNELWYLSYDGIYSWSGGMSAWRSQDIDPLFNGHTIGPYSPIDTRPHLGTAGADVVTMEYNDNEVFVSYLDTLGVPHRLRYHTKFKRWSIEDLSDILANGAPVGITAQFNDKTTGILYAAKSPNTFAFLYEEKSGTSDGWVDTPNDGQAIVYSLTPAAFTANAPSANKTFADLILEMKSTDIVTIQTFYDFSTTQDELFTIASNPNRVRIPNSIQGGYHKEAYAIQTRISGTTTGGGSFYSLTLNVVPLAQIQVGRAYDWDDLGWPFDKRLYQLVMEYDIPVGQTVVMNMDTMTGVIGVQQENTAVQSFVLAPPTTTGGKPNRITANFALNDNMIVKKVRLRPTVAGVPFKHFSYSFPGLSKYPADRTLYTEWSDLEYYGDKVFRTLNLEMNSSGLPCAVQLQGDSGNLGAPISVVTTLNDRARILTLQSDLISKNTRLVFTPSPGGYSQYFKHSFDFWKEPMAVTHWDSYEFNFGYNGYNFVKQVWLEYTCPNPILLTFFGDYGEPFYQITLPAHPQRDIERFYLPASTVDDDGETSLNKSKRKRFTIDVVQSTGGGTG